MIILNIVDEKEDIVRLIISDLHLGSLYSKEEKIYDLLRSIECDELILAGDVIDFIKVPKFTQKTAELFNLIKSLNSKVIYIVGNHDFVFRSFIGMTVDNIVFVDKYEFEYDGRKFRVEHGDKYEEGIIHWRYFMNFMSILQDFIERIFRYNLAELYVRLKNRKLKKIWDIVKWNNDADVFIMGHTHKPEVLIWVDKDENIKTYVNTGDWIQHSAYVIIKDRKLRLKNFS